LFTLIRHWFRYLYLEGYYKYYKVEVQVNIVLGSRTGLWCASLVCNMKKVLGVHGNKNTNAYIIVALGTYTELKT